MPTSRRRVVTQAKNSPPTAHWRSTVETWSFIGRRQSVLAFDFRWIPVNERRLGPTVADRRDRRGRRLDRPGSTDDGQLAGRLVEPLRAALGGHHDVFDAGAAAAREVDPRLDREGVAGRQRGGVAGHEVGVLVLLEADAVARPVDEEVAVTGGGDDRPGGG